MIIKILGKDEDKEDSKQDTDEKEINKPSDSLEDIVNPDNSNDDKFEYEVKDKNILDVSSNGTMNPKKDGHTQVKIKKNGKDFADVDVEVKDGKIAQVTSNTEDKSTEKKENINKEKVKKKV